MIVSPLWRGKRYAVLGLARSGVATVRALLAGGAQVVAWDSDNAKRDALAPPLQGRGWGGGVQQIPRPDSWRAPTPNPSPEGEGLLSFADPETLDLTQFDALIVSPGVPLNRHPIAAKARAAGVPIIGDIELFAQARASLPPHKVVGITGTNGKSTTTALVHHILQTAGVPSLMGGNIGLPILEQEPLPEGGVYVLELSSYQIDLTQTLDCDVAVLLNITPDHLDRYDGFEGYKASKLRLFEMMKPPHIGVFHHGEKDRLLYEHLRDTNDWRVWSNYDDNVDDPYDLWGAFDENGQTASRDHLSTQEDWPALQGPHNAQNAIAAILACNALEISDEIISEALKTFTGLPHRMERIRTVAGVAYVNDSKATNPDSTAPALAAFDRIHWILGGEAKTDDLDACAPSFGHVARAYTIGDAAAKFAHLLEGKVPVEQSGTLAVAVTSAAANAQPGDTVLLSPACASFDQFRDFEDRGDQFRALVEALDRDGGRMTDVRTPAKPWKSLKGRGGRADRSPLGMWFWDIDRMLLLLTLLLIAVGLVAVGAASPAAATRYSGDKHHVPPLFFLWWQLAWVSVSLPVLLVVSMLPIKIARRMALIGTVACLILLMLVPVIGVEKNGATRWLNLGVSLLQPSEFLKPFFIVTAAWLLSMRAQDEALPVVWITGGMTALVAVLLMLQPDFGQTVVFCTVWMALLMISGTSPKVIGGLIAAVPIGLGAAYLFYGTARARINAFLFPDTDGVGAADHFQTNAAHDTIIAGGWRGTGPGGGSMKFRLPEGQTDYIFSVIGEEFGLVACMIIALLFLAIVVRVFVKLLDEQDEFRLFAAAGLATQFGVQALISMAVNTGLAPSKGMTLPFISYGGSSLVALSIGMGLLLAFTRRNPFVTRSKYIAHPGGAHRSGV